MAGKSRAACPAPRGLELAAADPPLIRAGDAIDVLPGIAGELPAGEPRMVFHAATRMHVPADHLDAFDAAIACLNDNGPLWWLSIEDSPAPGPRTGSARRGAALILRTPSESGETIAVVDGHLRWIETVPPQDRPLRGSQHQTTPDAT